MQTEVTLSNRFQPFLWLKRLSWILGICFCLAALFGVFRIPQLRSDTPTGFRQESFQRVTVGTPAKKVFDAVGYPFTFVVHSLRPGGSWNPPVNWNAPVIYTNIIDAAHFLSNRNYRVVLEYARPLQAGGSYRARQVAIQDGRVINTAEYSVWAFWD